MAVILRKMLRIMPEKKFYLIAKSIIFPFRLLDDIIPKSASIIEVGTSYGLTAAYLAMSGKSRTILGIDNNRERIAKAKQYWKTVDNAKFKVDSLLGKIKVKERQIVLAVDLLHHISPAMQHDFFINCYNQFGKDNFLIIKEIDRKPLLKFFLNYLGDLAMNPGKFHYQSSGSLRTELNRIGFNVEYIRLKHLFYPHYVLICGKR